jgi:hypothetical protein
MKKYKKYYMVTIGDNVTVRELKSDLPFSIKEGKIYVLNNNPNATVKHITYKEVQRLQKIKLL